MANNKANGIFLDVDSSIVENNLRFAMNPQEEEFNKMFEMPQDNYPSKMVKPFPGFCVKTKEIGTEMKFFVNVCYTDAIPAPKDITETQLYDVLSSDESPDFKIPMSIGDIRNENDKNFEQVKICDIAINTKFFEKIQKIPLFKNFFMTAVFEGIKNKHGLISGDNKFILKNRKAFGTLQLHRIQQREIAEKMGKLFENNEKSPKIEVINSCKVETKKPEYRLFFRKDMPKFLIGEFKFPDVLSAKEINLDLGEDRILIEVSSRNYLLDIFVPQIIRQNSASSTFDKNTKVLTVKMPLVGG